MSLGVRKAWKSSDEAQSECSLQLALPCAVAFSKLTNTCSLTATFYLHTTVLMLMPIVVLVLVVTVVLVLVFMPYTEGGTSMLLPHKAYILRS
jgi:hypothetical protein